MSGGEVDGGGTGWSRVQRPAAAAQMRRRRRRQRDGGAGSGTSSELLSGCGEAEGGGRDLVSGGRGFEEGDSVRT
ncbi:unnamed protein product [Triticum turgidum subsp. durum]|uniref:Uncharacterized protein n=1 Tax=Triticum turgidum subsp. durum TaxID=4567 RepID=A0A9R0YGH7_TRITD|nr:unnamed protein product [Triticum turgidum subsp. durum]